MLCTNSNNKFRSITFISLLFLASYANRTTHEYEGRYIAVVSTIVNMMLRRIAAKIGLTCDTAPRGTAAWIQCGRNLTPLKNIIRFLLNTLLEMINRSVYTLQEIVLRYVLEYHYQACLYRFSSNIRFQSKPHLQQRNRSNQTSSPPALAALLGQSAIGVARIFDWGVL